MDPGASVVVLAAWLAIQPSNEPDWQPDVARLAFADIHGDRMVVHNVSNAVYWTEIGGCARPADPLPSGGQPVAHAAPVVQTP